jgi:glycosyltransferase involved in cell wall biosynthesis
LNIVLTCNFSPWSAYQGGGQRSTHMLASTLARLGHRVAVVYTKPPWERIDPPRDLPYSVHWAALPSLTSDRRASLRPLSALAVAASVRALARRGLADVVHGQGEEAALVRRVVDVPLVLTPRYPSYPPSLGPSATTGARVLGALRAPKFAGLALAAADAALVCATSRYSAGCVVAALAVPERRVRVVPNGVDAAFFAVQRAPCAPLGPLLFFGRVEHEKGADLLVPALAAGAHQRELHVVGDGGSLAPMRAAAARLGVSERVRFFPWESGAELRARLARAAVVVLPSREESFGNAMAEALAAGAPLVTTHVGSLPELVAERQSGLLVPPGEPHALCSAIDELLAQPAWAERMGQAGRSAMLARSTWEDVAKSFVDVYAEARAGRGAHRRSPRAGAAP